MATIFGLKIKKDHKGNPYLSQIYLKLPTGDGTGLIFVTETFTKIEIDDMIDFLISDLEKVRVEAKKKFK